MRAISRPAAAIIPDAAPSSGDSLLEQILDQIGEAVIVKDLDAVVTYWNHEAAALYGFTAQEAVGRSLRELHAADLSDADYERVTQRIRAGQPTSTSTERRTKTGETVRVHIRTTPLLDRRGELVGEITVARNITALHLTEEALRAAQATLEARLAANRDANRKLRQEIQARRKADELSRRKNEALAESVRQLESLRTANDALSRMAELLQACTERAEAYTMVREAGLYLFPQSAGSLHIYRESRDLLEHVTAWGRDGSPERHLSPGDCWALRIGKAHYVPANGTIRCRHEPGAGLSYACIPVQGQGQVLGLLHVELPVGAEAMRPAREAEQRLRAMSDRVGPALANLRLRDALREMALRDSLTGLYNRRYLEDGLEREMRRADRNGKPVSVIMIDVDHFKRFNDLYGHDAGDRVLTTIAGAVSANIRPSDIACRYGGEELAVVLGEAGLECAQQRAELIRDAVRATSLSHLGQALPPVTASFGVASYPAHGSSAAELLKAADRALYRAKQEGRNRVCVALTGLA